jgi:hypothetical protein
VNRPDPITLTATAPHLYRSATLAKIRFFVVTIACDPPAYVIACPECGATCAPAPALQMES